MTTNSATTEPKPSDDLSGVTVGDCDETWNWLDVFVGLIVMIFGLLLIHLGHQLGYPITGIGLVSLGKVLIWDSYFSL